MGLYNRRVAQVIGFLRSHSLSVGKFEINLTRMLLNGRATTRDGDRVCGGGSFGTVIHVPISSECAVARKFFRSPPNAVMGVSLGDIARWHELHQRLLSSAFTESFFLSLVTWGSFVDREDCLPPHFVTLYATHPLADMILRNNPPSNVSDPLPDQEFCSILCETAPRESETCTLEQFLSAAGPFDKIPSEILVRMPANLFSLFRSKAYSDSQYESIRSAQAYARLALYNYILFDLLLQLSGSLLSLSSLGIVHRDLFSRNIVLFQTNGSEPLTYRISVDSHSDLKSIGPELIASAFPYRVSIIDFGRSKFIASPLPSDFPPRQPGPVNRYCDALDELVLSLPTATVLPSQSCPNFLSSTSTSLLPTLSVPTTTTTTITITTTRRKSQSVVAAGDELVPDDPFEKWMFQYYCSSKKLGLTDAAYESSIGLFPPEAMDLLALVLQLSLNNQVGLAVPVRIWARRVLDHLLVACGFPIALVVQYGKSSEEVPHRAAEEYAILLTYMLKFPAKHDPQFLPTFVSFVWSEHFFCAIDAFWSVDNWPSTATGSPFFASMHRLFLFPSTTHSRSGETYATDASSLRRELSSMLSDACLSLPPCQPFVGRKRKTPEQSRVRHISAQTLLTSTDAGRRSLALYNIVHQRVLPSLWTPHFRSFLAQSQ